MPYYQFKAYNVLILLCARISIKLILFQTCQMNIALQSENSVSAYLQCKQIVQCTCLLAKKKQSEQILPFGFAW